MSSPVNRSTGFAGVALVGYTVIPALLVGLVDVREVKRNTITAAMTARYGVTPRLEVEGRLPYVYRQDSTISRELGEGTAIDTAFTRKGLRGLAFENAFAGATSFLRRTYTKDLTGVDLAITGVPFDQAVTHRTGTRFGPRAIREASSLQPYDPPHGWGTDPLADLNVIDYGDLAFDYAKTADFPETLEKFPRELDFISTVPADWSESHLIAGEVGDYAIFARKDRNSEDWYMGGVNDATGIAREVAHDEVELSHGNGKRHDE